VRKINWKKMKLEEIAALICDHLSKRGMNCVLSGGACVTIYSDNEYKSMDLDFVMPDYPRREIDAALDELGFIRTASIRHFENKGCPFLVEFPPSPLTTGEEVITKIRSMKTKYGTLKLLRPVDCIKDRLAAFYHWGDRQSLEQAIMVAKKNKVTMKELERWSAGEQSLDKYEIFKILLKTRRS